MYLKDKNIAIVGGGLVGSLLSIYLRKQGAKVNVFDKRIDPRLNKGAAGRSINLALSNRGINALEAVGLSQDVLDISMPMYRRIMHDENGCLTEQRYSNENKAIFSVSRRILNDRLIDFAEQSSVTFNFENECVAIDNKIMQLNFKDGNSLKFDFIFGADGAGSIVRKKIFNIDSRINVKEKFIDSGYKELTIPSASNGLKYSHQLSKDALHIWPRKSFMIIALPNLDGTFTCTLFAPLKGKNSFSELVSKSDVASFFSRYFQDLKDLIPNLENEYFNNPVSNLGYIRCSTWRKYNTILIGDASHATVPFYGQGMNSGFEDCYLLNEWLNKYHDLSNPHIDGFLDQRRLDTMAMQDLSMHNFKEMQEKTANPEFLLQKEIEQWFSTKHPDKWIPLYSMVTFSHMPYSHAIKKGAFQDQIMSKIIKLNKLESPFNLDEVVNKNIEQKIIDELNANSF